MSTQIATQKSIAPSFNFFDAAQFEVMQKISTMFSNSELVPEIYRASEKVTPEKASANCMIALSLSQRMGADALMVMQNLIIIQGRPSWSSKFLVATVNTCGRFETLKYRGGNKGKIGIIKIPNIVWKLAPGTANKIKVTEYTDVDYSHVDNLTMVAYTKEKGGDEDLVSSEVSIMMAILEGWYDKNGSKWPTMPEKMLKYRAASFWTNEYAPEISMGMKTEEEEMDIVDTEYVEVFDKVVKNTIDANANKTALDFSSDPSVSSNQDKEPVKSAIQPSSNFDTAQQTPDLNGGPASTPPKSRAPF